MRTFRMLMLAALVAAPAACVDDAPIDETPEEVVTGSDVVTDEHATVQAGPAVLCLGSETTVNVPGLLLTSQAVTATTTAILAPCISTDASLATGLAITSTTGMESCLDLGSPSTGTTTIAWNNGLTSAIAFNTFTIDVLGSGIQFSAGAVSAGAFVGRAAFKASVGVSMNLLACLAPPGLTGQFAAATLVIL